MSPSPILLLLVASVAAAAHDEFGDHVATMRAS